MAEERNKQEKQQEHQEHQEHQEQQEHKEPEQLDDLSDAQLTSLAADWSALDGTERTQLIQETRERMQPQARPLPAAQATQPNTPPNTPLMTAPVPHQVTIRPSGHTQRRRYGRLVRQADGSVVRSVVEVETRVVRGQAGDRQRAFGMGFERRHNGASPRQTPNSLTTPVSVPAPLAQ